MRSRIFLLSLLILSFILARPAMAKGLPEAEAQAREAAGEYLETSERRHKQLRRLKKDLRYISEVIDREIVMDRTMSLQEYSENVLKRLEHVERNGNIHPKLLPILKQLKELFRDLPNKTYAKDYARGLVKAIAHELRWTADTTKSEDELVRLLKKHLALPSSVDAKGWLKIDVPKAEFIAQGIIKVFIAKHRIKRPKKHTKTTAADIVAQKHNVQIGVEITGTVVRHNRFSIDGDYTFDIGDLHIELTPEWRATHRSIPKPTAGQRVRVRGWTYFDMFHKAEEEYNPEDPVLGVTRVTMWEIHPVMDIEILSSE